VERAGEGRWGRRAAAAGRALPIAAAVLLAAARPAGAQAGERIVSFEASYRIGRSGDLLVTEVIVYDFGPNERHGIFRDLPVRFRYDDTYDRVYPLEVRSVRASPGTPAGYEVVREGGLVRIRIGDPDRTITGRHTYEIAYRIGGALNGFPSHDELYWNAVGDGWPVPIDRVEVRVEGPAPIARVACFAGPTGSALPCTSARIRDGVARFAHEGLGPREGLTVVAALPKGAVPEPRPVLEERWSLGRAFAVTPLSVGLGLLLAVAAAAGLGRLLWVAGRDRRYRGSPVDVLHGNPTGLEQAVPLLEGGEGPVEFAPPEGIRPGQVGTLLDERANPLDITATIVDLAVRGYLVIEEVPKQSFFGKPDWILRKRRQADEDLLPYERKLFDALLGRRDRVKLSSLRTRFVERLREVQDALYEDAVARGWFPARPDRIRLRWALLGIGVNVLGDAALLAAARFTHLALAAVPLPLAGLALLISARWMPRRTAKGTAMVRRVHGFRRVIETAEAHQARWAERENVFPRYLPFAVVFGLTEKWARAFAGLAAPEQVSSWYVSSRPFTLDGFSDSIDGFAVTSAGTLASTPSSSGGSGFGGGGSAGGGGGGGGGGSW
jgi:hypothetical protein